MCTTLFAPQPTMAAPFESASRRQRSKIKRVEHSGHRKQLLSTKWVMFTGKYGCHRLAMHWTVAVSPAASTVKRG
jgi:hypothetical protein